MRGVRFVARLSAILGWVVLIVGILVAVGYSALGLQTAGTGITPLVVLVVGVVLALLLSLGPFAAWAALRLLLELHTQGERTLEALDDLKRVSSQGR